MFIACRRRMTTPSLLTNATHFSLRQPPPPTFFLFFFNDTATTEIYTLSLHDALPISWRRAFAPSIARCPRRSTGSSPTLDRKSTRLNSSHDQISYAVFCLKKKKTTYESGCQV